MSAAIDAPLDATVAAKPKSKKMLFIIIGVVVLALLGAGGALFILKKNTAEANEDGDTGSEVAADHKADPGEPPTFLPLDSMVVNLADPGGNRFVQLGITLQIQDTKTGDAIKVYMPSIRNSILMLVSQRTAEEILRTEGKEKLAKDISSEISSIMGYKTLENTTAQDKKQRRASSNPLQNVLFSSFIVQ